MKNNTVKILALSVLCVALALFAVIPLQTGSTDRSDWMSELDDGAVLNSISIPGTHDSGALHSIAEISGKCQSLSIKEQLKIGVRFLDIRLQLVNDRLRVVHSITDQMTDFEDVLEDMSDFIRNNESEFLIVSIKEDASSKKSDREFTEVLEEMLLSCSEIRRARELPDTVGEARGGIHVVSRYRGASLGVPCYDGWEDDASFVIEGIYVQDNYRVSNVEEKLADIHDTYAVSAKKTHSLVLNYTSCYLESSFPPIYAGLPAHKINRDTQNTLGNEHASGPFGVLVCDFMTAELAQAIIGRNFK